MNKAGKIILVIGICLFMIGLGYVVTKYLDKNLYLNTNLLVTFEDTKEFTLESKEVLTKEKAILEYPNKFTVENKSLKGVKYNLVFQTENKDIENLSFVLYLNDKEVKSGKLSSIEKVLYTNNIKTLKKDYYKLYIYKDSKGDIDFTYKIEIEAK